MLKKIMTAALALGLLAAPAMAADLFSPKIFETDDDAPASTWTGCYVGAIGGYSKTGVDVSAGGTSFESLELDGWKGGGQVGCDLQVNNKVVLGAFGDWVWSDSELSLSGGGDTLSVGIDDQWSVGLRAGYLVTPLTLVYVGGGYTQASVGDAEFNGVSVADISDADGFFGLIGGEHRLTGNLYLGGEVRYTQFDDVNVVGLPGVNFEPDDLSALATLKFKLGR